MQVDNTRESRRMRRGCRARAGRPRGRELLREERRRELWTDEGVFGQQGGRFEGRQTGWGGGGCFRLSMKAERSWEEKARGAVKVWAASERLMGRERRRECRGECRARAKMSATRRAMRGERGEAWKERSGDGRIAGAGDEDTDGGAK
eukprot:3188520-Pleurochrysis_carterae.AAC.2